MNKKVLLTIVAMVLMSGAVAKTETQTFNETATSAIGYDEGEDFSNDNYSEKQKSGKDYSIGGLEIACNGWKKVMMIDMAITGDWWYVACSPAWGEKNEYVKENSGFRLGGGLHKRVYIADGVYFDGRMGLHYQFVKINSYDGEHTESGGLYVHWEHTVKDYSDKKFHEGVFTFRPCMGFSLSSRISIFAAYEGCVSFKNGYGNSWSAGICFGF